MITPRLSPSASRGGGILRHATLTVADDDSLAWRDHKAVGLATFLVEAHQRGTRLLLAAELGPVQHPQCPTEPDLIAGPEFDRLPWLDPLTIDEGAVGRLQVGNQVGTRAST